MRLNLTFSLRRVSTGVGSAHAAATARARPARAPRGGSGNVSVNYNVILFSFKIIISGASYSSEDRGEARADLREQGGRSQHWRFSFRRYSEYSLIIFTYIM